MNQLQKFVNMINVHERTFIRKQQFVLQRLLNSTRSRLLFFLFPTELQVHVLQKARRFPDLAIVVNMPSKRGHMTYDLACADFASLFYGRLLWTLKLRAILSMRHLIQ